MTPCEVGRQLIAIAFGLALSMGVGFGFLDPESMNEWQLGLTFGGLAFVGVGVGRLILKRLMPCGK
jgi:hypothetical protein